MLQYIIRDLYGAMRCLPPGILCGALAAVFLSAHNRGRRAKGLEPVRVLPAAGFCVCLILILSMTLLSRESGADKGIDLELFSTWGINRRNNAYVVENVLLFLPYGFFGAWSFGRLRNLFFCAGLGLATSLFVESVQFLLQIGYFQIDDILTNLLGAVLGWALWGLCGLLFPRLFRH